MGLGPSIKMTTLHHFNCPATRHLLSDPQIDFAGVIVSGVSECYDEKLRSAEAVGQMAQKLELDGALIAIDGWGNHHIDFVNCFSALGKLGIPAVGLSFLGTQGALVCSNEYVGPIIDFNKTEAGTESCVVGQNNLSEYDVYKALALLKARMPQQVRLHTPAIESEIERHHLPVTDVRIGGGRSETRFIPNSSVLEIVSHPAENYIRSLDLLKQVSVSVIRPGQTHRLINSNLDFLPIARKAAGTIGSGVTDLLSGVTVMLTGVEDGSGYQPANIGSSEGFLDQQVAFNRVGTPKSSDFIIHIDCLFYEGQARTAQGIAQAHLAADYIIDEIRRCIPSSWSGSSAVRDSFCQAAHPGKPRVALIKLVSGLGNMYDTSLFPSEPCGYLGSEMIRENGNLPVYMTAAQVLDGAIHSLI